MENEGKTSRDALSAKARELAMLLHDNQMEARAVEIIRSKVAAKKLINEELLDIKTQVLIRLR